MNSKLKYIENWVNTSKDELAALNIEKRALEGQVKIIEVSKEEEIVALNKNIAILADSVSQREEKIKKLNDKIKAGLNGYSRWELFVAIFGKDK